MTNLLTTQLMNFIDASPTMFHTADNCKSVLKASGFTKLDCGKSWSLKEGGKYFLETNNSLVIAFIVNSTNIVNEGFRIVGTHGDVPSFKIKPCAEMQTEGYIKLNTEGYGGGILSSWLDRPLSIAGRVSLVSEDVLHPAISLIDFKRPLAIIPNLAIHMNRDVNNGIKINKQKDTLPILGFSNEPITESLMLNLLAEELDVTSDKILDAELFLYPYETSMCIGLNKEFISAPRLDNLSMTYSALNALINSQGKTGISLFVCFDNEEIGSHTKQGADSPILVQTLERIMLALGKSREEFFMALSKSFVISADVAHLSHPNYMEKSDPTNKVLPGNGPAIKVNANFSYTTDSDSFGVFANLCKINDIPYQVFVNRSDERGGSTIGPIASSHLGIRSVDIGTPMLAMHSARELMAEKDFIYTTRVLNCFFNL